jgi:hypothetical protein
MTHPLDCPVTYQIEIAGKLNRHWSEWLDDLSITIHSAGDGSYTTHFSGPVADQAALRGILCKVWDLNLVVLSVSRCDESKGISR